MAEQLTVRLPPDLNQALERAAVRFQRKRSEIVRMALVHFLELETAGEKTHAQKVEHLLGGLESGIPDLLEEPRRHLLESIQRGG